MNSKAAKYLRENEVAQHLLFGITMFFISVLVYFVALDLVQLPRDVSFYSAIGFLGVLIIAYTTLISTRTKRKEKVQ
jgi:predicted ferric reductase